METRVDEELEDARLLKDFTAASDYEVFVHRLQEIIISWKNAGLTKSVSIGETADGEQQTPYWEIVTERDIKLEYISYSLHLCRAHRHAKAHGQDSSVREEEEEQPFAALYDTDNDFPQGGALPEIKGDEETREITLAGAKFGFPLFGVLSSVTLSHASDLSSRDTLLSAISMALVDAEADIPMLVNHGRTLFGMAYGSGFTLNLEAFSFNKYTVHSRHFSRLVDVYNLFKNKISPVDVAVPVTLSAESTFKLRSRFVPDSIPSPLYGENLSIPPFGYSSEIMSLDFSASWTDVNVDNVVELDWCSEFDPTLADRWAARLTFWECPNGRLQMYFSDFIKLADVEDRVTALLPDIPMVELMAGSSGVPVMRMPTNNIEKKSMEPFIKECFGEISPDTIINVLKYVFSDDGSEKLDENNGEGFAVKSDFFKAGTAQDILWKLVCALASLSKGHYRYNIMAHVWYEFIQELRYRWQNCMNIPGVMEGYPNTRYCLLLQKLQMLNICINRRRKRDEIAALAKTEQSSDSGEDFFDCDNNEETGEDEEHEENKKYLPWDKPVGRLSKFGNLKLLKTGDPIYIPVTQEPIPKTEDQIELDAQVMLSLGSSDEQSSDTMRRIMSASMLSDMESFKAANPGAIFEDFIRWYSPRDWIEEEELGDHGQKKGHLSNRMLISDNIWTDVWKTAQPVPAKRQGRLFDDTREAEKILHFLETSTISQVVEMLLPSLTHVVISTIAEKCRNRPELPKLCDSFEKLVNLAKRLTRDKAEPSKYAILNNHIYTLETSIVTSNLLKKTLHIDPSDTDEDVIVFLKELLNGQRSNVCNKINSFKLIMENKMSDNIDTLTKNSCKAESKEYILRAMASKPSTCSRPCIQMMRVKMNPDGYEIISAFSEDSIFY